MLTPRAIALHHGRVSAETFAYPHCPFREVTHAAARRAPLARRLAVILWPSARRAEHVELTTAGIVARGLFGGIEMRWAEIAGAGREERAGIIQHTPCLWRESEHGHLRQIR